MWGSQFKMKTGSNPETALLLKKPEVQERLVEIRDSNEYSTWETVRDKFNTEYDTNISMTAIKNSYNKAMATSIKVSGPAQQHFEGMFEGMSKRLNNVVTVTDDMIKRFNSALETIQESYDLSDLEKAERIMELTPKLDKLNTAVIKQLAFLSSQMSHVTLEQKKMQWDDNRVKNELDRLQPIRLQILEEDGKIAIIDRTLLENK